MQPARTAPFVALVVALLGAVGIAYWWFLGDDAVPPTAPVQSPAAVTKAPDAIGAQLREASGVVELQVGSSWRPALAGQSLGVGAEVRTGADGMARISYGGGITAEVEADSSIQLDRLDGDVARFVVGQGLVVIDVDETAPDKKRVQLAARGSDAVLETQGGRIAVLNDGKGGVQAAVTRGEGRLSSAGQEVQLGAGQQSAVAPGGPPSKPTPIPASLLLKVKWPARETSARQQRVVGHTSPGARVRVGGKIVTADPTTGRFAALVELAEGRNKILVQVIDVLGRQEHQESPPIEVDTRAPAVSVETGPQLWKRDPKAGGQP